MTSQTTVHLVYIHGFQGNDTTFQSFPTDLQNHLAALAPPHLQIRSSLYPTYKSVKPIAEATHNFIKWLSTQEPGPVILLGHSMGGLLAADAATDLTNTSKTPWRIIGMVAFDTPYLAMHPHVIQSGIASLFAKKDEGGDDGSKRVGGGRKQTEKEMNDTGADVTVVGHEVTDDWEEFKKTIPPPSPSPGIGSRSHSPFHPASLPRSPPTTPFLDKTLSMLSTLSNDPFVQWMRKHSDEPVTAAKRWIVEHFQFGICMFDPSGLKDRYQRLVAWDGQWVNYWTETVCLMKDEDHAKLIEDRSKSALNSVVVSDGKTESDITRSSQEMGGLVVASTSLLSLDPPVLGPRTKSEDKAAIKAVKEERKAREKEEKDAGKARKQALKQVEKERKKAEKGRVLRHAHHFITLPTVLGGALGGAEKWERIEIAGVEDEVQAHCGLFIPTQNLDYDNFVNRVGSRILGWCSAL